MRISYVNGHYVPHRDAVVHMEDRGYQFSDGIYEYYVYFNGRILDEALHMKRLERSLKELSIPMPMSRRAMELVMRELIERNGKPNGALYVQITRGVSRRDHPFPKQKIKPAMTMAVMPSKAPSGKQIAEGVEVITMEDIRWGRRDIKSVSLLANVLARQASADKGVRETWLVNPDGCITEGSASNSYIVTAKGEIRTAPADHNILGGITRDVVLKIARKAQITVIEKPFTVKEAQEASEAFLTSTSANILPVVKIDGKKVGSGKPGKVTQRLLELYMEHIEKAMSA